VDYVLLPWQFLQNDRINSVLSEDKLTLR
jgi:hypothetical protein